MATTGSNDEEHHTAFLDDAGKEVLLERYLDLKFVDDVPELSCTRCGRVVIFHYMANCGHLFCKNCKRILSINEQWKNQCPLCNEYITHIERQEVEVERRVNELTVHCPNHKYGCKVTGLLQHIPEHLAVCVETREANLPALSKEDHETNLNIYSNSDMSEMSKHMSKLSEQCDRLLRLNAMNDNKHEQLDKKIDNLETIAKGSAFITAKLQAEVADISSRLTALESETRQKSQELNTKLSEMDTQLETKTNDDSKQELQGNQIKSLQTKLYKMEQNIKANLPQDYSQQMSKIWGKVDQLSNDFAIKPSEIASKASSIQKLEELEGKLKDFQMKLDAMEQKTNSSPDYRQQINEIQRKCNQLTIGHENQSAQTASQLSDIKNSLTKQFEELDDKRRKYFQVKLDEMKQDMKTNPSQDYSHQMNALTKEVKQLSTDLDNKLAETASQQSAMEANLTKQCHELDVHRRKDFQVKLDAIEQTIKTNPTQDYDQQINKIRKKVNQLSIVLADKSVETESQICEIKSRLTKKFEELDDSRRKDFQMKSDLLSAARNNESRHNVDGLRRTASNAANTTVDNITMPRVLQTPRKPILANEHGTPEFNILLLGPTESGKSTFVNLLANYLKYRTFDEAEAGGIQCLTPGSFTFRMSSRDWKTVAFGGPSENEETGRLARHSQLRRSKTKACKSYDFNYNQCLIRVIDSPGIYSFQKGETPFNLTNILDAIRKYRQLHAIMIVVNISDGFMFSKLPVEDMLLRLGQSAVANVTWLFTSTNNTLAESTSSAIRKMLSDVEGKRNSEPRIPLNERNSFHLDNRAFRHLILKSRGLSEDAKGMRTTWSYSVNECKRMLHYVINGPDGKGLQPLPINNTFRL